MPPHGHNYSDDWWEDLPDKAKRAAKVLGYDQESWDTDAPVPYDSQSFSECSYQEKQAAMYLHMSPIDKKLDLWWDDVDEETKKYAHVLGWDHHKWDDDWEIEDLPCEHWNWNDMTNEQQEAGRHFGYGRGTWDYVEDEEEDFDTVRTNPLSFRLSTCFYTKKMNHTNCCIYSSYLFVLDAVVQWSWWWWW